MNEPLLEVTGLTVRFHARGARPLLAVDDVSFGLSGGQVLGLVGESGCGKTSVARCLTGLLPPASGEVRLDGVTLSARRSAEQHRAIQMVFQHPYSSLNPRMTVRQTLSELLRVHHLAPGKVRDDRCRELMSLVGLPADALDGLPGQFSGGQRQRIAIARALAVEPRVLVADEPVSSLDVSVQSAILRLFNDLRTRLGLTMVLISHNLAVVRHLSDQVAVMYLGRIVEQGSREEIFTDPRHPYTRALLDAAPRLHQRHASPPQLKGEPTNPLDMPSGCHFHPRCPIAQEICRQRDPVPVGIPDGGDHLAACHFASDLPGDRGLSAPNADAAAGGSASAAFGS
jgi:oligopeptide/dipeptide ABC transporter ATP-binding protein